MKAEMSPEAVLGRETVRRLGGVVRSFVTSEVGGRAKALAALLLALMVGINALNVLNSYVSRYFMTAIERREWTEFVRLAFVYIGVFAVLTGVGVVFRFIEERLGLLWREWLTKRLVGFYLDKRTYYRLHEVGTLGNPDQRIADDVRAFTTSTLSLTLIFLNGAFTIIAFSGVLWSISRMLFIVATAYAVIGSGLAFLLGRPLVRLTYDQSDKEADFRSNLIHVRENAESVALLNREPHIEERLRRQVDAFTANLKRIIAVNRNLGFFATGYDYLIQVIPVLIVAPLFMRGETEFGTIPQSAMAFTLVVGAFSLVVKQFPQLSTYAAVLARLSALASAAEETSERKGNGISIVEEQDRFAFDRLTLRSPNDGRTLVRELSLEVPTRSRVLITTPSEVETVALQRAVAGIWESGEGRIVRPPLKEILLLPDRPYLPPGTLRELLVGSARPPVPPGTMRERLRPAVPDDQIWSDLGIAAVGDAVRRAGGLDVELDWNSVLSLQEQRLLSVARILLERPRFAVLARPDTSVGGERATRIMDALAERGVGCIVLGEGTLARASFGAVVEIAADGSWTETRRPGP